MLTHGDARPSNVMLSLDAATYAALLDWGDAKWRDPASEFAQMPLRAVPRVLEGYREVAPPEVDEGRVLWYHLSWALLALARRPTPNERVWSAPPAGRLAELMRFFAERPGPVWRRLLPRC